MDSDDLMRSHSQARLNGEKEQLLTFKLPQEEVGFVQSNQIHFQKTLRNMAVCCTLAAAFSVSFDPMTTMSAALAMAGAGLFLIMTLLTFTPVMLISPAIAGIFALAGLLVALAPMFDATSNTTSLGTWGITLILVIIHVGNMMPGPVILFKQLIVVSILLTVASCIPPVVWMVTIEQHQQSASTMFLIFSTIVRILLCAMMCSSSYRCEKFHRIWYIQLLHVEKLNGERQELRHDVFVGAMEKVGVPVMEEEAMDLDSPAQKGMAKLQKLLKNTDLPMEVFRELKEITMLIGRNDFFQVNIEDALADKKIKVDAETEQYLRNLMSNGAATETNELSMEPFRMSTVQDLDAEESTSLPGAISLAAGIEDKEQQTFRTLMNNMDEWDFDVFEMVKITKGHPLLLLGMALFTKYDLIAKFKIDAQKLRHFLGVIEDGYKPMPYHNSTHASDVTRTVHFFVKSSLKGILTDEELLALVTASIIHDYDHPGRNNNFLISTSDPLALLYNDKAVLENHHAASSSIIMRKDKNKFLDALSAEQNKFVRKNIIELVLATDLSNHFAFVGQFKLAVTANAIDVTNADSRLMLSKMALKCGDLGHASKPLALHKNWTMRVTEEFYCQGDDERKADLTISPFMNRRQADLPRSQVGFMNFLVMPMYEEFMKYIDPENVLPCMSNLKNNLNHWKNEQQKGADPK